MLGTNLVFCLALTVGGVLSNEKEQLQLVLDWDGVSPAPISLPEIVRQCDAILARKDLDKTRRLLVLWRKSDAEYYSSRDAASTEAALEALELQSDNVESLWRLGRILGQTEGKTHEALEIGQKLVKAYPDSPYGYFLIGAYHNSRNDAAKALPYFDQCIEKAPMLTKRYLMRAFAELCTNRFHESIKSIDKALSLPPTQFDEYPGACLVRGGALHALGKFSEACADLLQSKRSKISSKNINTVNILLWTCYAHQRKYGAALSLSEEMVKFDPDGLNGHIARSRSLAQFGHLDESESEANVAIALAPNNAGALLALAIVKELKGDYPGAFATYGRSIQLTEKVPATDAALRLAFFGATCPVEKSRNGQGVRKFAETLCASIKPVVHRRTAYIVLSMAQAECGEFEKAVETIRKAAKMGDPDPDLVGRCNRLRLLYEQGKAYRHDPSRPRDQIFSIDPATLVYDQSPTVKLD
jgi:tetratricopeptide (TPR) repeat protein